MNNKVIKRRALIRLLLSITLTVAVCITARSQNVWNVCTGTTYQYGHCVLFPSSPYCTTCTLNYVMGDPTGFQITWGWTSPYQTLTITWLKPGTYYLPYSCESSYRTVTVTKAETQYPVTGGGVLCNGSRTVRLTNSENSLMYGLRKGTTYYGSSQLGSPGTALEWTVTQAGTYEVVASYGCSYSSGPASIGFATVTDPVAYTVLGGGNYCAGGTGLTVTLSGTQSGVSYELYKNDAFVAQSTKTGDGYPNHPLAWNNLTDIGTYTIKALGDCSTRWNMSGQAIITGTIAYTLSGGGANCLPISLSGSQTGVSYQLKVDGTNVGSPLAGTGAALQWPVQIVPGAYTATASSPSCSTPMSMNGVANVSSQPLAVPTGPATVCAGSTGNIYSTASGMSNYTWSVSAGGTITSGGTSTSNTVTVRWNVEGAQNVSVSYTQSNGNCRLGTGVLNVTVNAAPVPTINLGPSQVCVASTGNVYTTQSGMSNYVWSVTGGTITAGGTSSSNTATITWTTAGTQTVSVNYTDANGCAGSSAGSQSVLVSSPPAAITSVNGLKVSFINERTGLQVVDATDATSFTWIAPTGGSFSNSGTGGVAGREVTIINSVSGPLTYSVKAVKDGCAGPSTTVPVFIVPSKSATLTLSSPEIQSSGEKFIFLDKHSSAYTTGCIDSYGAINLRVKGDFGDVYNLGKGSFSVTVNATITAYYDLPAQSQSWPVSYTLTPNVPEQLFTQAAVSNLDKIRFIGVKVTSYTSNDPVALSYVRLYGDYSEGDVVSGSSVLTTLTSPSGNAVLTGSWDQTFQWTGCADVPNYEFQLLRLYGDEPADWSQALTLYTESSTPQLTIALAEGGNSSIYKWRVRAIGNTVDGHGVGGIANPMNLQSAWSAVSSFTYSHPEDGKNWIYSRTFTEGNTLSEQVTYANGLQQISQQQIRIQGINQVVASETIQDYVGRNAVTSLPIPVVGQSSLGYVNGLLKSSATNTNFGAVHFDGDPSLITDAATVSAADISGYYSGVDQPAINNKGVANAEGFPYTRTMFTADGTGRVQEQSGVGKTHAMVGNQRKTVKTFYSNPTDAELVRLFGQEAPQTKSVQKVVTYDANGTGNATYKTKDGKVIATALVINGAGATSPLQPLSSQASGTIVVFDDANQNTRQDDYTAIMRKPLLFNTDNTTLTVDYEITPGLLQGLCGSNANNTSLIGYYPFEGNTNDLSGKGNTGIASGGIALAADAFGGQCYNMDGNDDYIAIGDSPDVDFGSGDFTVSMWVKKNANTVGWDNHVGINKWNNGGSPGTNEWGLFLATTANNNIPSFAIESGSTTYSVNATANLALNTWYQVAGVRRGDKLEIYVNGQLQGSYTLPNASVVVNNVGRSVWIGRTGTGYNTNAAYDEVVLYKRALGVDEMNQLYQHNGLWGGPICKTCDYTVDFFLRKADDPNYNHPGLPPSHTIQVGGCMDQASLKWDPVAFNLTELSAGVNYVLEKRITTKNINPATGKTYLQEGEESLRSFYQAQADATLGSNTTANTINYFIANNDLNGLNAYLNTNYSSSFDASTQQYTIPVGVGSTGCKQYIFVPKLQACANETADGNCKLNTLTYEGYFEDYMAKNNSEYVLKAGTTLNYAYFRNRYTNTLQYFQAGQLDQMITNLIAENSGTQGRVTCQMAWDAIIQETGAFMARRNMDLSTATADDLSNVSPSSLPVADPDDPTKTLTSLYENVLAALEGKLKDMMPAVTAVDGSQVSDYCDGGSDKPYFIRKTELYGHISGGATTNATTPDLTHAYKLLFFDERVADMASALRFYAGITNASTPVSITDFNNLTVCKKYKLSQQTQNGDQHLGNEATESVKALAKIRSNCNIVCAGRAEEFRQAIINNIMATNNAAKIQNYAVHKSAMHTSKWVGVRDASVNPTIFDYSECEIDAMVDALIENCKGYCNTPFTKFTQVANDGTTVTRYGTDVEWSRIKQSLTYNFEVSVSPLAQSCGITLDQVTQPSPKSLMWFRTNNNGDLYGSFDVDPAGNTVYVDVSLENNGKIVSLLSKIALNGNVVFEKKFEGPGRFSAVKIDNANNILTYGMILSGSFDFDPSPTGNAIFNSDNNSNRFIAKYDVNGNYLWHIILKIDGTQPYPNFEVNNQNEILLATGFLGTCDFDPSSAVYNLTSTSNRSNFFAKYDQNGNFLLAKKLEATNVAVIYSFYIYDAIFDQSGNVYITGNIPTDSPIDIDPSSNSFILSASPSNYTTFVAKYDPSGNLIWGKALVHYANKLAIRNNNQLVITSVYSHVALWDLNGNMILEKDMGSGSDYDIISMTNNPINDSFILVGRFRNTVDFDVTSGVVLRTSQGGDDAFVAEYDYNFILKNLLTYDASGDELVYAVRTDQYGNYNLKLLFLDTQLKEIDIDPSTRVQKVLTQSYYLTKNLANAGSPCSITHSLCFRFTTPLTQVSVPDGMNDVVYDPKGETCEQASLKSLKASLDQQVEQLINDRINSFREQYKGCVSPSSISDKLTLNYNTGLHHFTLYYYDRAGNLMRTVPPKGVALLDVSTAAKLATARTLLPAHTLVTEYQYNSLGQLVREHTPDGNNDPAAPVADYTRPASTSTESVLNATKYYATHIYNDKGMLRFSRNAKQKGLNTYSYSKYDELGRVIEVGEMSGYDETTLYNNRNNNSTFPTGGVQTTTTYYTMAYLGTLPTGYTEQHFLRNRVSYAMNDEDGNLSTVADQTTSIYSYDTHGNVEWLVQMIPGLPAMALRYEYDLISGKVTRVNYNPGQPDQFYHKYAYDANNRITEVYTSRDGYLWEKEANYEYYLHGPLRRTELGEDKLQGIDYTYTIHGWLKAINQVQLDKVNDPSYGKSVVDGAAGSAVGRDAFGMALTYFNGDYKHTGSPLDIANAGTYNQAVTSDLYNGNVAAWTSRNYYTGSSNPTYANANLETTTKNYATGFVYTYDQLNRLLLSNMTYLNGSTWTSLGSKYRSSNTYDANGNILGQVIYDDNTASWLDNIPGTGAGQFNYYANTNRLGNVPDAIANTPFSQDVEPQAAGNYTYDAIGNLTNDAQQQTNITWSPYGKVMTVTKAGVGTTAFRYDAAGNRVSKKRTTLAGIAITTYYVRDASGNIMSVYEKREEGTQAPDITQIEVPIYGSDRLGQYISPIDITAPTTVPLLSGESRIVANESKSVYDGSPSYLVNPGVTLMLAPGFTNQVSGVNQNLTVRISQTGGIPSPAAGMYSRQLNTRQYEMKDHLGNIRAVLTDTKLSVITAGVPGAYEPEVTSIQNYYPFGMDQPNRSWNAASKYRYGFNGKEKDDTGEWGSANYDYGFRIYNPSIGKFLSVDPLTMEYPWYTPYQFAGNTPIWAVDLDGLEPRTSTSTSDHAIVNEKKQYYESIQKPEFQRRQEELEHGAIKPAPSMLTSFLRTIESGQYRIPFKPIVSVAYEIPNSFAKVLSFKSLGGRPVQGDEEYKSAALTVALTLTPLKGLTNVKTSTTIFRVQRSGKFLELDAANNVVFNASGGYGKTVYMFVGDEAGALRYAADKPGSVITAFEINSNYANTILRLKHPQSFGLKSISASDAHVLGGYYRIGVHSNKIEGFLKWQVPGSGRIINP